MRGDYMPRLTIEAHNEMTLIELVQAVEDGFTDVGEHASGVELRDIEGMAITIWQDLRQDENYDAEYNFTHRERIDK
jgi:hypothetical protein